MAVAVAAAIVVAPLRASADEWLLKNPGAHPSYVFEAEPHGLVGFAGPFKEKGKGVKLGAGFRATIVIADRGILRKINDSVGITFGGDFFFGDKGTVFLPVAMQWNFWLTNHWSVFGEPGFAIAGKRLEFKDEVFHPIIMGGGRYHFTDRFALTLRGGYPAASVGVSFFF
jgi:hypothetical protein